MLPDRWRLVRSILEGALERSEEHRDEFVVKAAAGDAELLREVRALLGKERTRTREPFAPAVLERVALGALEPVPSGTRIGPFQLDARIAAGGMGEVWRARRVDGFAQVEGREQTVAIKLIKLGMDTEEMLRRFANERALLAGLQHDGIARLFDGGADERGRPYLVMEFVDGLSIDRYCDEHALTIRQRIELFLGVCEAVAFAHERLVVHRDIKPSNILVTRDGRPKLLDFGIGKVLAAEGHAPAADRTRTGQRVLTPAYASPEQLAGQRITTQSDVYSLGLVLWELCALQRAFPGERTADTTLPRASAAIAQRTGSRRLAREVVGDLDTILAAACHVDPARRYRSVNDLADDLRACIAHQPVRARRDSAGYRVSKFVRRNRLLVASLVVIFASLASATLVSSRMYLRAADARDEEAAQREIAAERFEETRELATKFLFDVHDSITDLPGATAVRETLLTRATSTLDRLAARSAASHDLDADLFAAYVRLAETQCQPGHASLGRTDDAVETLDKAQAIADRRADLDPQRNEWLAEIEYLRGNVAFAKRATLEAEEHYATCFALLSALRPRALEPKDLRRRGDAAARLSSTTRLAGRLDEAACWLERLAASRAAQTDASLEESLNDRAVLELERSQLSEARGDLYAALDDRRMALLHMEQLVGIRPASMGLKRRVATISAALAQLLTRLGRSEEAADAARGGSDTLREIVLQDPNDDFSQEALCTSLYAQGRAEFDLGHWCAASELFDEIAAVAEQRSARDPSRWGALNFRAAARTMHASAELGAGHWIRALELFEESLVYADAASRGAPIGQRAGPVSYQTQVAGSIAHAIDRREAGADAQSFQRALEIAKRGLSAGEQRLSEFEPNAGEAAIYRMLSQEHERLRTQLGELAVREP